GFVKVVRTGPNRPVGPVGPGTGHASGSVRHDHYSQQG
ncbi:hypothetical protein A2U01_0091315, partial [Trifolium medium]|nr:hypothetical protein [Trifolium medium]